MKLIFVINLLMSPMAHADALKMVVNPNNVGFWISGAYDPFVNDFLWVGYYDHKEQFLWALQLISARHLKTYADQCQKVQATSKASGKNMIFSDEKLSNGFYCDYSQENSSDRLFRREDQK